ncbi:MAG: VWA domain-containing protein [Thiomargarita sp.]|nr:VWA domain-containing protein [Thiomargarita sp.]
MTTIDHDKYLDRVQFVDEPTEPKCPCVLLLDISDSMSQRDDYGKRPIDELNDGLMIFQNSLQEDTLTSIRVEVAIITFGGEEAALEQDFVIARQFKAPKLSTYGRTPMGNAIHLGLDKIRDRKTLYKQQGIPYYRPWVFLITDGLPTDDWQSAAQRVKQEEANKSVAFFAVGVQDADMRTLANISVQPPAKLAGLNFRDLFVWLSTSLSSVSQSQKGSQLQLPPVNWAINGT